MTDFNTLLTTYQSLIDKAGKERDPEHRKFLEQQANANFELLQRTPAPPSWELGEGVEVPKPAKGKPTVTAGVTSLPPSELDRVRQVAESHAAPNVDAEFAPNAGHGASAQPQRGPATRTVMGMTTTEQSAPADNARGLLDVNAPYRPKVAGVTPDVAAEVQPQAAPQAPQTSNPMSWEEFQRTFGGGGGGPGRAQMSGAMANAGAAGEASDAADAAERTAILSRAGQQQDDGRKLGETMAAFAQTMKASDEEHQAYLAQARERIGGLIQESKVAAEEFRAATREQGFMQSLSSGGRVGAAISLALGALGGSLTGQGGNAAMDVLKFRVDEDLRNRSLNINAKGAALDAVDGLLARNMQIFGDEVSAREATRAAIFDSLKLEVQRQSAISGGVDSMGAAKQLVAGMDAEKARAEEVLANQQLQAMLKAARAGGGMNKLKLFKEYQAYLKNDVGIQTDATKLAALQGNGPQQKPDLYSEEGKRASDRITRLHKSVEPFDKTVRAADLLLTKVGVPDVQTRARAGIGEWLTDPESSTLIKLTPLGLLAAPIGSLSSEQNQQMSALFAFTAAKVKASQGSGQLSEGDMKRAIQKELRQSWLVDQNSLIAQIRNDRAQAETGRKEALASDPEAAAELESERKRLGLMEPSKQGGTGIPDYGRAF
jgi:hypothetical protein